MAWKKNGKEGGAGYRGRIANISLAKMIKERSVKALM